MHQTRGDISPGHYQYQPVNPVQRPSHQTQYIEQDRGLELVLDVVGHLEHVIRPGILVQGAPVLVDLVQAAGACLDLAQADKQQQGQHDLSRDGKENQITFHGALPCC